MVSVLLLGPSHMQLKDWKGVYSPPTVRFSEYIQCQCGVKFIKIGYELAFRDCWRSANTMK